MAVIWYRMGDLDFRRDEMADSQSYIAKIEIDGEWDIVDLADLADSFSESYGLFYPLVATDDEVRSRLQDLVRKQFWSGGIETRKFGRVLYRNIPTADRLKLRSFTYASAGVMELAGYIACIGALARVARAWMTASSELLVLWAKVDKFFQDRSHLRRPARKTVVDDSLVLSSEEARALCVDISEKLGFDEISRERIIEIAGNPIAALKFFVAAGVEGQKLARLQDEGLLRLPTIDGGAVRAPSKTGRRVGASGVPVETRKSRRRKPKPKKED